MPSMDKLSSYRTTWADDHSATSVTYVSTMIVFYDKPNGTITLKSGGWETVTTKRKMNQAARQFGLGFAVYQRKGEWFLDRGFETGHGWEWLGLNIPFVDGMTFPRHVGVHAAEVLGQNEATKRFAAKREEGRLRNETWLARANREAMTA